MPEYFGRRNYLVLFGLILISMAVFTLHFREGENGPVHRLQRSMLAITAPIQSVVTTIVSPISDGWEYLIHFGQLTRENRQLSHDVAELQSQVTKLHNLRDENNRLRKLLQFKDQTTYETVTARVIGIPSSSWWSSIVINKGTNDSVSRDMPVVAGGGLVGQITEASGNQAMVMLLNDSESGVSALIQRTGEIGVVNGQLRNKKLSLRYVSRDSFAHTGDAVYTSGLGGLFPKGLYIGKITSVKQSNYSLYKVIEITPPVDYANLDNVIIVLTKSGFSVKENN